ncbi:NAD(P)-dependent oxidoreductase [Microbacterium sp.]|uniref:NAD(P)-dependent oxidoreductase n=1 Tax=Microbacterium sp. TaxID=51671 RepID=UPI0037C7F590
MIAPQSGWPVGFIGLGVMGRPIALRLAGAGIPLLVWNRSAAASADLAAAGARVADSPQEVLRSARIIFVMLRDERVVDDLLHPQAAAFPWLAAGSTIVNLGTVSPEYSRLLGARVREAGGYFVEAPVSGSRIPAEQGQLVAMVAGEPAAVAEVTPLLAPACARIVECGEVPSATTMKLAANTFLIATVTGLAEAFHIGRHRGVDLEVLRQVLDASQMASPISRIKAEKLLGDDLTPQAAIRDVLMNADLIVEDARRTGAASPLLDVCRDLYRDAVARGDGDADMIAVIGAIGDRGRGSADVAAAKGTAA